MFTQVYQSEHDADTEEGTEGDACGSSLANAVVWYVASCCIHPAAVAEHMRFEIVEDEVTFRLIRDGAIAVHGVVKVFQCCEVEVEAIDNRICRIVAGLEL